MVSPHKTLTAPKLASPSPNNPLFLLLPEHIFSKSRADQAISLLKILLRLVVRIKFKFLNIPHKAPHGLLLPISLASFPVAVLHMMFLPATHEDLPIPKRVLLLHVSMSLFLLFL